MNLPQWLRQLSDQVRVSRCDASRRRQLSKASRVVQPCRVRPRLEALEERLTPTTFTPTTFTPTTFADEGSANSLRGAITHANNDTGTATDHRGYARIAGNAVDIGAYESGATPATDLSVRGTAPARSPLKKSFER